MPIGTPTKEAKAKIKTNPVTPEAEISFLKNKSFLLLTHWFLNILLRFCFAKTLYSLPSTFI